MVRVRLRDRSFRGGVHPRDEKALTRDLPLRDTPDPDVLLLPLQQHLGRPSVPVVKKGEWVREGQLLADAQDGISAVVRAPRAGTIAAIQTGTTASGFPGRIIALKPGPPPPSADGEAPRETGPVTLPRLDPAAVTPADVVARAREAGIVGQGGAAFPTAVKLAPPKDAKLDVLIVNGCECEPYLTRDYRLMIERPADLVEGSALLARTLGVARVVIGVENNKLDAAHALRAAAAAPGRAAWTRGGAIDVRPLRTKYPQGAEKMLIEAATRRRVPPGGLPMSVGAAIQNVGTVLAVRDAVVDGRVQTDAVLTVSGRGVRRPANLRVAVGTPVADVIAHCGGLTDDKQTAVVYEPDCGTSLSLIKIGRGDKDRDAVPEKLIEYLPEVPPGAGVDAAGGLVKKEDLGGVDECTGKPELLFHPTRQLTCQSRLEGSKVAESKQSLSTGWSLFHGDPEEIGVEGDILHHREVLVESEPL